MEREAVNHHDVIVIGASAGGVDIVQQLAAGLPRDLPAAVFIAMHVPAYHKTLLPEILARSGPLPASEASDGERIRHGHIYVARSGRHLLLDHGVVRVAEEAVELLGEPVGMVFHVRPPFPGTGRRRRGRRRKRSGPARPAPGPRAAR